MKKIMKNNIKKVIAAILVLAFVVGYLPQARKNVVAADVETTIACSGYRADAGQYVFSFNMDSAESAGDIYWNCGAPVTIDGRVVSDSNCVNWLGDTAGSNTMHLVVQASVFESGINSTSELGSHTLVVEKETTIGEITITNSIGFTISGQEIIEKTMVTFQHINATAQDEFQRYLISVNVTGVTMEDRFWNNNKVLIDDVEKTGDGVNYSPATESQAYLCLGYNQVEEGKSTAAAIGEHSLVIPAGTLFGTDCMIANTLTYRIVGEIVETSVPRETVALTDRPEHGSPDGKGFYFVVDPADSFPNDETWATNTAFAKGGVSIDGELKSEVFLKKILPNLYYVPFIDVGITVEAGQVVTVDGSIKNDDVEVVFTETKFVFTGSEWNVYEETAEKVKETVSLSDRPADGSSDGNGFYFVVDPADSFPNDETWNTNTSFATGGVSINGELKTEVFLKKILPNLYYVPLIDVGITAEKGQIVTVDGTISNDDVEVTFTETDFVFTGSEWNVFTEDDKEEEEERKEWIAQECTVYDLFELESTSTIEVPNDVYFNLTDLKKSTNVGLRAHVELDYENEYQDFTLTIGKTVANNVWVESGYSVKIYPQNGMIRLFAKNQDVGVALASCEDVKEAFDIEYGLVNMLDAKGELVARKLYVNINDNEVLTYYDKNLDYELGTYVPAFAYSHNGKFKAVVGSIEHKGYELVNKKATVKDLSELIGGISILDVTPDAITYVGDAKKSENIAIKTKVQIDSKFDTYEEPRYDEIKIGIGQTDPNTIWDIQKSGYEVWFRPGVVFIGKGDSEVAAQVAYELPKEFTLEFGTYNIEVHKNGEKTADYGRMVYVKIDGNEVLNWIDKDLERELGTHVIAFATKSVDATLKSLTSNKYLIRKDNKVYDLYDAVGLSEVVLTKNNLTKLGQLPKSTSAALRTKVKLNKNSTEFKLAISKTSDDNFWDIEKSGWEFWFRPASNQIFIGYEHEKYGAVIGHEFSKEFVLEVGERDVTYNDGKKYGREVYIMIDGKEVISWIDKDYNRKLGTYVSAWASENSNITLTSLTTKGYVPKDAAYETKDLFDVSEYASVKLVKNDCILLGSRDDFRNTSIKMNVTTNKNATEFKLATGKVSDTTIWDIEESGWQFWFRPASNQIFIGYGASEYAEVIGYEIPEQFELEIGTRNVNFENGKFYGVRVFININGEEVISWIDTDTKRTIGKHIIAYASGDADVTLSTQYKTANLSVGYIINGEEQEECELIEVQTEVVVGKPSKIGVRVLKDPEYYVTYEGFSVNESALEPQEEKDETFVYYLESPTDSDTLTVTATIKELTTDEPTVVDFFDVTEKESIQVGAFQDAPIGNMIYENNPCKANSAMQFVMELPDTFNSARVSLFGDWICVWGYSGFIVNVMNGKILIQYPATENILAEGMSSLCMPGNTIVLEAGIVKCYADGVYTYDRYYVKAGETVDDMEMVVWYDSVWRGGYGSAVFARGTDIEGKNFTLKSTQQLCKVVNVSNEKETNKLESFAQLGEEIFAVYYPENVVRGDMVAIKLRAGEGMVLDTLKVNGKKVKATLNEDGTYIYECKAEGDIEFSYILKKGSAN